MKKKDNRYNVSYKQMFKRIPKLYKFNNEKDSISIDHLRIMTYNVRKFNVFNWLKIKNIDTELIEMSTIYKVDKSKIIKEVYLPAITPFIFSGVSSAMGFGWRAVIIGEVLSQPKFGIGTLMQTAQTFLLVNEVIAWTIIAIIISYLFELIIRKTQKRIVVWK